MHADDADKLNTNKKHGFPSLNVDEFLKEGIIKFGTIDVNVIFTPGHSKGCVCYLIESANAIFTGDTLFKDCVGRSDFLDSSTADLMNSIKNKLFILKRDYTVYPGHGEPTSLFYEKESNPYVN